MRPTSHTSSPHNAQGPQQVLLTHSAISADSVPRSSFTAEHAEVAEKNLSENNLCALFVLCYEKFSGLLLVGRDSNPDERLSGMETRSTQHLFTIWDILQGHERLWSIPVPVKVKCFI